MIYLHACYHPDTPDHLLFFGEDRSVVLPKKRGRPRRDIGTVKHPFHLSYSQISALLSDYQEIQDAIEASVSLSLPAKGTVPLLPDEEASPEGISFISYEYPAMAVPVKTLSSLFPLLGTRPGNGMILTDSIHFYRIAFHYALASLNQGRYLPHLSSRGPDGRWSAFIGSDEQEQIVMLGSAMPGICYAFSAGCRDPKELVGHFIDSCVNTILKSVLLIKKSPVSTRLATNTKPEAQWISLLWGNPITGTDPLQEDSVFVKKASDWLFGLITDTKKPAFSTCLRLREPSEKNDQFRVDFLLQASDDPSLLVSAEEIWKKRSASLVYVNRRFDRPQEKMLKDLYRAGNIFLPIQEALKSKRPDGFFLEHDQVYSFLHEAVPLLQSCQISIILPAWWKDSAKRPVMRLVVTPDRERKKSAEGSGFFTLDTILSFQWEISIGEVSLSADEFQKLVDLKMPLVHVGGKWVVFNAQEIQKAIETFQKRYHDNRIPAIDALRLGLAGTDETGVSVHVTGKDSDTSTIFSSLLGTGVSGQIEEVTVPETFKGVLRPYQKTGLSWLMYLGRLGLGACLADDMGLGKTVQLIAYILAARKQGMDGPVFLVCPMTLLSNWQHEIARFAPSLSIHVHHGACRTKPDLFSKKVLKCDMILSTYQMIHRDQELFTSVVWDLIVLDEAQNIKNSATLQAKAVRSLSGKRKVALTGTPVENRLTELWSIMEFLNPGYLGGEKPFQKVYSRPIEKYQDKEASVRLKKLIHPFVLRRVKTDRSIIADLPLKNIMKRYCTLTPEQATLYQTMVDGVLTEVTDAQGIARRAIILTALLRLKQICNHPDAFLDDGNLTPERSGKIGLLFSLLEDVVMAGDAAILFTQFPGYGERLVRCIRETFHEEVLFLSGKTPRAAREEMVLRFSHPQGPRIFLLSLKAGGVGLNLTRASHVFHLDRWWNPAVEDQATDRAYRIGQKKNVSVHLLISTGTIEERIDTMMEKKRSLAGSIIGTGEDWVTSLSNDELKELFTLRDELIGGE